MTDVTVSVTTAGGSGGGQSFNNNSEGKTTPRSFNVGEDARSMENGGQYPNYWSHKTRSGHSFIMDDSEGNETVTLQHRSGTAIQMRPDGGMLLTTHNGKYEVVLGEERVTISGASDITVKGDTSLRCYGDYNVTVHKDYNLTVMGNMNVTSKNLNRSIRGTMDTEAKAVNKRVEGSITYNSQGAQTYLSKGDTSIASTGKGKVQVVAASGDLGVHALGSSANMVIASANKMWQKSTNDFNGIFGSSQSGGGSSESQPIHQVSVSKKGVKVKTQQADYNHEVTTGNMTTKVAQNYNVKSTGGNISAQAAGGSIQQQASQNIVHKSGQSYQATAGASMDMRAPSGTASFVGGSTNISSLSGMLGIAGTAGVAVDALGSLLNLNSGIAQIAQALGINLNFDFGQSADAASVPTLKGTQANQPTQEQDASSEINSWT